MNVTLDHKPVIRVNFSKLRCMDHMKQIRFPLMYGLLGSDHIWLRYNFLKTCNLRVGGGGAIKAINLALILLLNKVTHPQGML